DNDGDGLIDCADSDCAGNPACKTEICGNCIDDDGDGLVDSDDPDCCDNTNPLLLRRMTVRSQPQAIGKNKLRIKARYSATTPENFNPGTQGTQLQISDANGNFFCQNIPFHNDDKWLKKGVFMFK